MAPRTKAQQEAYNAKRRAESAAKKAPAKTVVRAAKPARALKGKPKPKVSAYQEAVEDQRAISRDKPKSANTQAFEAAELRRAAAPAPIVATEGKPVDRTMPGSYVRSGGAGMGKLRGKTFQATVSFTAEQMPQIVEAAKFRGVSLAEMIRSCVVQHLNKFKPQG